MKYAVWSLVLLLTILHLDLWYWEDSRLVAGIMPVGLFYHAGMSLAAAVVWYLATRFAWPFDDSEDAGSGGAV